MSKRVSPPPPASLPGSWSAGPSRHLERPVSAIGVPLSRSASGHRRAVAHVPAVPRKWPKETRVALRLGRKYCPDYAISLQRNLSASAWGHSRCPGISDWLSAQQQRVKCVPFAQTGHSSWAVQLLARSRRADLGPRSSYWKDLQSGDAGVVLRLKEIPERRRERRSPRGWDFRAAARAPLYAGVDQPRQRCVPVIGLQSCFRPTASP